MTSNPIEQLAKQIDAWRQLKRHKSEKMPESLWKEAANLASKFSLQKVAEQCKLNSGNLKNRLQIGGTKKSTAGHEKKKSISAPNYLKPSFINLSETMITNDNNSIKNNLNGDKKCILKLETKSGICIEVFE
ncbi:MAG: hypothetical protein HQK52_18310 [Oligoflexia bacterium]|nr:hypothetical protein [Oligoflexia bacterium]